MSRYIPVKGYSGLVRDTETNAIINTDRSAIQRAREQKELRKMKRVEERELKSTSQIKQENKNLKKYNINLII